MFDFSGQVVIVTGASGNLGQAVAEGFAQAGAHLVLVDRSPDRLSQHYPALAASPDHWLASGIDATDVEAMRQMTTTAMARWGHLDVLVNTVGGYRAGQPLHEAGLDQLDFMLNLNLRSTWVACQSVIPHMLAQGAGAIVNVAARASLAGGANSAAYSAAKGAVLRLTESLSAEVKARGIHVNAVLPGTIDTPQNRKETPNADYSRWVAPAALADVILFLASGAARAIHGAGIPVYGLS
jgi:NAD(P)-dependent dehydrogenase (short-subunit alcohol dehydrogenase family)